MKQEKIIAFINAVINQKFNIKAKGYDPEEVDKVIDDIFENFKSYIQQNYDITKQNEYLSQQNEELKKENKNLKNDNAILQSTINRLQSAGASFDVINNRLNRLEENQLENNHKKTKKQ